MNMWHWFLDSIKKSFVIKGRAPRIAFWSFLLFSFPLFFFLGFLNRQGQKSSFESTYVFIWLIIFVIWRIPYSTLCVRRLHDMGNRGWIVAVSLVIGILFGICGLIFPVVSHFDLLLWIFDLFFFAVLAFSPGNLGDNEYGPNPLSTQPVNPAPYPAPSSTHPLSTPYVGAQHSAAPPYTPPSAPSPNPVPPHAGVNFQYRASPANISSGQQQSPPPSVTPESAAINAAQSGDVDAQYRLGMMYANGQDVSKNDHQAAVWLQKAAEQGHAEARYRIGLIYAKGQGVPQDREMARHWLQQAAMQGVVQAKIILEEFI